MELEEARVLALQKYLGLDDDDDIEQSWDECVFEIAPATIKDGKPPSYWIERAEGLKKMFADARINLGKWEHLVAIDTDQFVRHGFVKNLLAETGLSFTDYNIDQNDLWHLMADDRYDSWHVYAIRAAFNGEEVEDRRKDRHINAGEYMVLTDDEADERAREYIEQSLWAFRPGFLANMTDMPYQAFEKLSELCESANDLVLAIVEKTCGLDELVEEAISADGRAHFLNTYDGNEDEVTVVDDEFASEWEFYVYRTN